MATIRDLCLTIGSGATPSRKQNEFFSGSIPWLKTKELADAEILDTEEHISERALAESSCKLLPPGTVVMAMYGATVGRLGVMGREMTTNQACCAMVADPKLLDNRYLFYWLKNSRRRIRDLSNGAAQQNLSVRTIGAIEIDPPPIEIQARIGAVLRSLDDKIAADTSAMFMAEQLIDALVYENVSTNCSVPIADELILHYGKSLPASKRVPGQIPVIGSGGIVGWHSSPLIEDPTVVVGRKGSIGALHWIDSSSFPIDTTFWVQPKRLPTRILYSLLKLVDFSGSNTDSAVPGLNRSMAYEMPLPFISDEAVAAVWDRVSSLDALCSHLKREVTCLAKTRDELLPLLMSGKITVKEAEQEATAAGADIASEENKA